jgi:chromosomal replication initiation ATPase DnaA
MNPNLNPNLNPKLVIRNVCRLAGVKQKDLLSKRRPAPLAWNRAVAIYFVSRICRLSAIQTAVFFPLHSRSGILYARQIVADAMSAYPEIKRNLEMMEAVLRSPPFKTIRPEPSQASPTSRES